METQGTKRIADFRLPIADLKTRSVNRQSAIGNRQFSHAIRAIRAIRAMTLLPALGLLSLLASRAEEPAKPPAPSVPDGFAVQAAAAPPGWLPGKIPPGWREHRQADPWRSMGTVNTVMPPLGREDKARGFVLFVRSYCDQVLPDTVPTAEESTAPLTAFACPGEYEPASFGVRALQALKALRVDVGPLSGPAGSIPRSCVDLRVVRYLPIPFGEAAAKKYALRPLVLERRETVDIAANTTVRYWLTVKVPADAKPGLYTATINIGPSDSPKAQVAAGPRTLRFSLRVLPFRLQRPPTAYAFCHLLTKDWKYFAHTEPNTLRHHCVDMAEHGMNSAFFYTLPSITRDKQQWRLDFDRPAAPYPSSLAEQIQAYCAAGLTQRLIWYLGDLNLTLKPFSLRTGTAEMEGAYRTVVRQVEEWRKRKGLPQWRYQPHDEIDASVQRTEDGLFYLGALKKQEVPTFMTYIGSKDRRKASLPRIDAVCFAGDVFRAEFVAETRQAKKELWVYSGNARYGLDPKGDRYFFGLFAMRAGADGVLQWAYQWPPATRGETNPYDMLAAGQQGWTYAFPTPDGVLPTIGLEGIREGIDDARYVHTLRQWIARARASKHDPARTLANEAEKRLHAVLNKIDINDKNIHFLDDLAKYGKANQLTCHQQPDAMTGADFERYRWQWAEDIMALQQATADK